MSTLDLSLPPSFTYGKVVGRIIHAIADTAETPDDKPHARAAAGKVKFTPQNTLRRATDVGQTAIVTQGPQEAVLSASGRVLDAEGRQGIWLVAGVWTVSFELASLGQGLARPTVPSFTIQVTTDHTDDAPLDLADVLPYQAPAGVQVQTLAVPQGGEPGQVLVRTAGGGLAWTAGSAGPIGPIGPAGPQGVKGDPGKDGQDGAPGKDGQDGAPGVKGDPGAAGDTGGITRSHVVLDRPVNATFNFPGRVRPRETNRLLVIVRNLGANPVQVTYNTRANGDLQGPPNGVWLWTIQPGEEIAVTETVDAIFYRSTTASVPIRVGVYTELRNP